MNRIIGLGLTAGLAGGIAAFGFARVLVSPLVDQAIGHGETHAHGEEHEIFSRALQENVGAGVGTVMFAVVLGALFAVAVATVSMHLTRRGAVADPRWMVSGLAATGFVAVNLVPAIRFPANPPGVGMADTIGARTTAYLVLLLVSVGLAIVAVALAARLSPRLGTWSAVAVAGWGYLIGVTLVALALPHFDEVSDHFPAALLADFRLFSLLTQALMWLVLGTVFAALLPRVLTPRTVDAHR
ncbi:CbtA family protein [Mycobacterium sp. shizuoka-1]|uniref:CbtA family protein n=1 Tax=Mycobacterium sp. shizuoka-1 TaxID=2039281 RepID=UPI000C05EB56|nr:CbtA family protein [Mycobacterium sp. shizuoka-1]GAY14255.1 membrane protein [Mycobacterium sp. shizuoka-1]